MDFGEAEGGHQFGLGLVGFADDADNLVDVQKGGHAPVEDVDAFEHLFQAVLQAAGYGGYAEIEPLLQDGFQVFLRGAVVEPDHHQIGRHIAFQPGLRH